MIVPLIYFFLITPAKLQPTLGPFMGMKSLENATDVKLSTFKTAPEPCRAQILQQNSDLVIACE